MFQLDMVYIIGSAMVAAEPWHRISVLFAVSMAEVTMIVMDFSAETYIHSGVYVQDELEVSLSYPVSQEFHKDLDAVLFA